jgi:uncharacterized membrane protein SirB2
VTEWYPALRAVHIACVVATFTLFALRGAWMLLESPRLQARWVRIAPHVIDTLLLVSAIGLTLAIRQYPLANAWLTAKLAGLVAYIVLGTIALKRGRTKTIRSIALAAALLVFGYIVLVARSHSALPLG